MAITPEIGAALAAFVVALVTALSAWLRKIGEPKAADPPPAPTCAGEGLSGSLAAISATLDKHSEILIRIEDRTRR